MELEELKKIYNDFDDKLNANLKLNKELLVSMNLKNLKSEIRVPYVYEIINAILSILVVCIFLYYSFEYLSILKYSLSGFISAFLLSINFVLACWKIIRFSKIEYYDQPVIVLQKQITQINKIIAKSRKIEMICLALVIVTMFPVLFKAVYNVNIYNDLRLFIIMIIVFFGVNLPLALWINKTVYDKRLQKATDFIKEFKKYEQETITK